MSDAPALTPADVALAILNSGASMSPRAGGFCGQVVVSSTTLSPKQKTWLAQLAQRAGIEWEAE